MRVAGCRLLAFKLSQGPSGRLEKVGGTNADKAFAARLGKGALTHVCRLMLGRNRAFSEDGS